MIDFGPQAQRTRCTSLGSFLFSPPRREEREEPTGDLYYIALYLAFLRVLRAFAVKYPSHGMGGVAGFSGNPGRAQTDNG